MKRSHPFRPLLGLLVAAGSVLSLSAHPAQFHSADTAGAVSAGLLHPLTGLDHLVVMVAVGLWAVQIGGRALWLLPVSFVTSMVFGGAIGLASAMAPMALGTAVSEHGIIASVFLFGAALGMAWQPRVWVAVLVTAMAGLCHGFAHGSEMPSGLLPLLYLAGMIAATSLLHGLGIGGGLALRRSGTPLLLRASGALVLVFAVYNALQSVS